MGKKWNELYARIPLERRDRIESCVQGMIARLNKQPLDEMQNSDWRYGWGEADYIELGSQVSERDRRSAKGL